MIILQFGLRGLSIKRTRLFGRTPYRMISVRFLVGEMHWLRDAKAPEMIREAVKGLMRDPDWLVKNAPSVRVARKKAEARALSMIESQYRDDLSRCIEQIRDLDKRNNELKNENLSLQRSLLALARDMETTP